MASKHCPAWLWLAALCLLLGGCATSSKVTWENRIGSYSFDQAVLDYGPPDKSATLTDGTKVHEWLTSHGNRSAWVYPLGAYSRHYAWSPASPDCYLRLSFGPEGKLKTWKKVFK
jgi:hypothetical protein